MKKLITLITAILLMAGTAKAKTTETTLWNGTYTDGVVLNSETVATFAEGDILRVYVTVPSGGANFKIVYKGESNSWTETTIPSIATQWPWVNEGDTYKDFALTAADKTALSGMNIYLYQTASSITKVSRITTELDETTLFNTPTAMGDWTEIDENTLTSTMLADVKEGDKLVVNASASDGGQVWIAKLTGNSWTETNLLEGVSITTSVSYTLTADDANIIKERGIRIKGKNFTLSSLGLVKASIKAIISSSGIGTFCSSKNLDFTDTGVTPYYASGAVTGTVTLTSVSTTASGSGYILRGSEGVYAIPVTAESVTAPTTNYLKATGDNAQEVAASIEGTYHYIFAKHNTETAFFKLEAAHTLAAHKAYLETSTDITPSGESSAPRRITLDFGNGTTAVLPIENDFAGQQNLREDGVYYTLQGTRVQNPSKGLYILNGKKVLVK